VTAITSQTAAVSISPSGGAWSVNWPGNSSIAAIAATQPKNAQV
jgi:hypothetical protein